MLHAYSHFEFWSREARPKLDLSNRAKHPLYIEPVDTKPAAAVVEKYRQQVFRGLFIWI